MNITSATGNPIASGFPTSQEAESWVRKHYPVLFIEEEEEETVVYVEPGFTLIISEG